MLALLGLASTLGAPSAQALGTSGVAQVARPQVPTSSTAPLDIGRSVDLEGTEATPSAAEPGRAAPDWAWITLGVGLASHLPVRAGPAGPPDLEGRWAWGVPLQLGLQLGRVQAAFGFTLGSGALDPAALSARDGPGLSQASPELRFELLARYRLDPEGGLAPFLGLKAEARVSSLSFRSQDYREECLEIPSTEGRTLCLGTEGLGLSQDRLGFGIGPLLGARQRLSEGPGFSLDLLGEAWLEGTTWSEDSRWLGALSEASFARFQALEALSAGGLSWELGMRVLLEARVGVDDARSVGAGPAAVSWVVGAGGQAQLPLRSLGLSAEPSVGAPLLLGFDWGEALQLRLELGYGTGFFDPEGLAKRGGQGGISDAEAEQRLGLVARYAWWDGGAWRPFLGLRSGIRRTRLNYVNGDRLEECEGQEPKACLGERLTYFRMWLEGLSVGPVLGARGTVVEAAPFALDWVVSAWAELGFWRTRSELFRPKEGPTGDYPSLATTRPDGPTVELGLQLLLEGRLALF